METLVAVAVFAIVFVAALALYTAANRAYLTTDAATVQQQNVRFALDRMVDTLRDSGSNHNTMGSRKLPDEQVEGAWESAVFVRGDYDNSREADRETLNDPVHGIVTIGNDEIVGYVLRKQGQCLDNLDNDGDTLFDLADPGCSSTGDNSEAASGFQDPNTVTLSLSLDVTPTVRDGSITGTTISGEDTAQVKVAATNLAGQTSPPYQLTRVTFDDSGSAEYEVIADNIYSLVLDYYNSANAEVTPPGALNGSNNADRTTRATIRRFEIDLKGVADRPDLNYKDPTDTTSLTNRRKFQLQQTAVASNLGITGKKHELVPAITINAPDWIRVCTGHCRHFNVTWADSSSFGVTQYKLKIEAAAGGSFSAVSEELILNNTERPYEYEIADATDNRTYSFSVAAYSGGNTSTFTGPADNAALQTSGTSIPNNVSGASATQTSGAYSMDVRFAEVTQNTTALGANTCVRAGAGAGTSVPTATWNQDAVDLTTYEVYRTRTGGTADVRVDSGAGATIGELSNAGTLSTPFIDRLAAPCAEYSYKLKACDLCGVTSAAMSTASAPFSYTPSDSTVRPGTPVLTGSSVVAGSSYAVSLSWTAITRTAGNELAATSRYRITRTRKLSSESVYSNPTTFDVDDSLTWSDPSSPPTTVGGFAAMYQYTARGVYACGPDRLGDESAPFVAACTPAAGNTMTIAMPTATTEMSRPYESVITPRLTTAGSAWVKATVTITGPGSGSYNQVINAAPVSNTYTFPNLDISDLSTFPNGTYTMTAVAETSLGCQSPVATVTFSLSQGTCGLALVPSSPLLTPTSGNPANRFKELNFTLQNTCDAPLAAIQINGLTFTWSSGAAGSVINRITYNGVNNTTGLTTGSGTLIPLGATVTLNPATTSAAFKIFYSGKMDTASWTSILARAINPSNLDETLTTTTLP